MVPVVVEPVTLSPLYAPLIHLDLTGLDEAAAVARLRDRPAGGRPTTAPPFPRAEPADRRATVRRYLAGGVAVPPRNPRLTGRDGMLAVDGFAALQLFRLTAVADQRARTGSAAAAAVDNAPPRAASAKTPVPDPPDTSRASRLLPVMLPR
jgi:hypothetical protein